MKDVWILCFGDIAVLGLVTLVGFSTHDEAATAGWRMMTTFLPLVVAWFLLAPVMGVFDPERTADLRQLWRPFWAMVMAAPFATLLRGIWLGRPILPIFVVVLGGVAALSLLAWRLLYWLIRARK